MEIIAWNIQMGGGPRSQKIAADLCRRNPDLIVLGEYQAGTSGSLIRALFEAGWPYHAIPEPPGRFGGIAVPSKSKITAHPLPSGLVPFAFRFMPVEIPEWNLHVRAVYAPLHKDPYVEFWKAMLDSLESDAGKEILLIGDLNSGISNVDAPVPDVFCSNHFSGLSSRGYTDFWREKHGIDAREYTWQGRVNPYRLDHAFGTVELKKRLLACDYDHSVRESGLSDHSLLSVKLAPSPSRTSQ